MCAGCASTISLVRIYVALATHHASEAGVGDMDFGDGFEPGPDWLRSPELSASSSGGATSGSSSSSSSESDSSDSSDPSDEDPTAAVGERAAAAEPAEPRRASRRRGRQAEPAPPDPMLKRHRRDETFEWRDFRFTFRRPGTDARKPGFMALCRHHSAGENTKCTRTATWNHESERAAIIRKLKTWCVKAGDYPDRRQHQGHVTAEVLDDDALEAAQLPPLPEP